MASFKFKHKYRIRQRCIYEHVPKDWMSMMDRIAPDLSPTDNLGATVEERIENVILRFNSVPDRILRLG